MRFGKKLLAAIERGEWVRMRSWPKGQKMRKGSGGRFVNEEGLIGGVGATAVLADDWVIVRKKAKAPKAPQAPKADDPRYEPIETMPVVGDRIEHPDNVGEADAESLRHTVSAIQEHGPDYLWMVEADGLASLGSNGYGWRILKRRNVFTDPKPGDVISRADTTLEVRFVDADAVLFRWDDGSFAGGSRNDLAARAATAGWTVRKLGS